MLALKRNIDIILILIIGFVLRFSVAITHSYTNDELSAINRFRFDNFSDLIEKGVKTGDMHPAGIQIFEKGWSSIFGTSELALRFPFVLCGVASIFLIFLIGMKWFNRRTGIFAAAILSVLYFPIIQSELARPYSPGLLITLLTAWFYHKVLFCEVKKYKNAIFLGLCFAAGMYTHYFLFLFLVFIGFTGLFFLKRDNSKLYFLAVAIAILLFIPHISITLYHLGVGGLGWLAPPEHDFIFVFLFYAFNESWIFLIFILTLILISFFQKSDEEKFKTKYYFLVGIWFFGIYAIGFILSYVSTPVLKIPVMLFAFPFFILMVAYLISKIRQEKIILFLILTLGFFSTYFEQDLYGNKHMGYKSIAQHMVDWNKKYGEENIYTVYNLSDPNYMNFYANKLGDTIDFDWDVIEFSDDVLIRRDLMNRTEEYCIVGYSERLTLPQVFETVKEFYPVVVEDYHFDNSAVFLMKKDSMLLPYQTTLEENPTPLLLKADEIILQYHDTSNLLCYGAYSGFVLYDYYPEFIFKTSEIENVEKKYLKIVVHAECPIDGQLTATISGTRNGQQLIQPNGENFWMGHDLEEMLISTRKGGGAGSAYFAFEIPDFINNTDELKISLWNRNGKRIVIHWFEIYVLENNWN